MLAVAKTIRRDLLLGSALLAALAGCSSGTDSTTARTPDAPASSESSPAAGFPTSAFARLSSEPLPTELAAHLQRTLDDEAGKSGMTAALVTPEGSWTGAAGTADALRAMRPEDQMAIGSITKTIVAAQVMQLVEAGEMNLDDPAADHLPGGLEFDSNGATIADLLGMRSGIPDYVDALWDSLSTDKRRVWDTEELLALVGSDRAPAGRQFEYSSTNYALLGLILEHTTGRPVAEVLRDGVLDGAEYERLIYQPDQAPTRPMAAPGGAPARTLRDGGGYLPSLAGVTSAGPAGAMASDSATLSRWWGRLCGGRVLSEASLDTMTNHEDGDGYGLGVQLLWGEHGPAVGHGGVHVGFNSYAACLPEKRIVLAVLANDEDLDTSSVADTLVRAISPR